MKNNNCKRPLNRPTYLVKFNTQDSIFIVSRPTHEKIVSKPSLSDPLFSPKKLRFSTINFKDKVRPTFL